MSTVAYSSQSNQAKPSKAIYCSVDGKAKLVKRIYGSVGGQAKIIYDTCTVSYIKDNGYTNNTTVTYTEVIGKGCIPPQKDNLHWYKSDGTEWNFATDRVQGDVTLYEAVYQSITSVTFDGNHYVSTQNEIHPSISNWDCRGTCTPTNVTVQRRVFGARAGSGTLEMYINGSGYWNIGVNNTTWSAASNKVKATVNYTMSWRWNLATSSTKYLQIWQDNYSSSNGNWSSCTAANFSVTNTDFVIGWTSAKTDLPFIGGIRTISWTGEALRPYKRIKGGSTLEGYRRETTAKFYPLLAR